MKITLNGKPAFRDAPKATGPAPIRREPITLVPRKLALRGRLRRLFK